MTLTPTATLLAACAVGEDCRAELEEPVGARGRAVDEDGRPRVRRFHRRGLRLQPVFRVRPAVLLLHRAGLVDRDAVP